MLVFEIQLCLNVNRRRDCSAHPIEASRHQVFFEPFQQIFQKEDSAFFKELRVFDPSFEVHGKYLLDIGFYHPKNYLKAQTAVSGSLLVHLPDIGVEAAGIELKGDDKKDW